MNLIDRTITYLSPELGLKRHKARIANKYLQQSSKRFFDAASTSERMDGWVTPKSSANTENFFAINNIRDRSRDLIRNNPYASRAVNVWTSNAIGTGILPQIKSENKKLRGEVEKIWAKWAETTDCDFENRRNLYGIQSLAFRSIVESGEVFIRICKRNTFDRPHFQLQLLEADHLDTYRQGRSDNSVTSQGIEFSKKAGRLAYWLFPEHPGDYFSFGVAGVTSHRVGADEVLHIYRQDRPGQIRGIPWAASVITRLRDFDGYEDAQLLRQKIAASFAGFLEDIEPPIDFKVGKTGQAYKKISPGTVEYLPPGKRITFNSPPSAEGYSEYSRQILHGISVGFGVPYEALTGDLSQVNFSSGRMGFLEFNRQIEHARWHMFIPQFCEPVWNEFERFLRLRGIDVKSIKKSWVPPRREMIDPNAEVSADIKAIRGGLKTLNQAIREQGDDPEDHYEEMAEVNSTLDRLGLTLDSDPRVVNQTGAVQPIPTEDETKEKQKGSA